MPPSIGRTLHKARTDRGIDLSEVERATKIRLKFLEAMEADRWEELPGPAYARGFLEIYARHLGLDREELLTRYSSEVEGESHEPIPQWVIKPGTLRQDRPARRTSIDLGPVVKVAAGAIVLVVVGLVVIGVLGGSDDGGGSDGKQAKRAAGTGTSRSSSTAETTTTPTNASEVSVELRATAPVWVCLVDQGGTALVDSETLDASESRGPFTARRFEVTFGNGSVDLTIDGRPARVPRLAEPLGYRITPSGLRPLDPSSQPTCS
jgi:cytoskeletal protein RodZ